MKKLRTLAILLIAIVFITCKDSKKIIVKTEPSEKIIQTYFDGEQLLNNIKTLASDNFEGRRTGTKGGEKARDFIITKYKEQHVKPLGETFEQAFSFEGRDKKYNAANVLGFIEGTKHKEKYIVISAHYDHLGIRKKEGQKDSIYNGADDDASGSSALISFANYFKSNPPKHSVILAAFDAEEMGLRGAKHFVNNSIIPYDSIIVNLNMDMISRNDKNELYVVGTRYNPKLKELITNFEQPKNIKLLIGHDGEDKKDDWTGSSDHGAFYKKGTPFLYFGVEDHVDYHGADDSYENIHPAFYEEAVRVIIDVFKEIDSRKL